MSVCAFCDVTSLKVLSEKTDQRINVGFHPTSLVLSPICCSHRQSYDFIGQRFEAFIFESEFLTVICN